MPLDDERLIVALEARIRDFERNMAKAGRTADQRFSGIERRAKLSGDRLQGSLSQAAMRMNTSMKAMMAGFAGGVIGGAATGLFAGITSDIAGTVKGIAEIGDEAKRAGVSVTAFQEWRFVADQNRVSVDALTDGLKELNLRADEWIVTGSGPAAEAFARLGYSAADLKEKLEDPSKLMLEIIGRMKNFDQAAQIRIADEVFGGTGGEQFVQLIGQGEDALRRTIERAHEAGLVLDTEMIQKAAELDRKFGEVSQRVSNLAKTIVVNLAGSIEEALTIDVDDIFGSAERAASMMGEANYKAMKEVNYATEDQVRSIQGLADTYDGLFRLINAATGPNGLRLMDVADIDEAHELAAILHDIDREMIAFKNGAISAGEFEDKVTELTAEAQSLILELDAIDAKRFESVVGAIDGIAQALKTAWRMLWLFGLTSQVEMKKV